MWGQAQRPAGRRSGVDGYAMEKVHVQWMDGTKERQGMSMGDCHYRKWQLAAKGANQQISWSSSTTVKALSKKKLLTREGTGTPSFDAATSDWHRLPEARKRTMNGIHRRDGRRWSARRAQWETEARSDGRAVRAIHG